MVAKSEKTLINNSLFLYLENIENLYPKTIHQKHKIIVVKKLNDIHDRKGPPFPNIAKEAPALIAKNKSNNKSDTIAIFFRGKLNFTFLSNLNFTPNKTQGNNKI